MPCPMQSMKLSDNSECTLSRVLLLVKEVHVVSFLIIGGAVKEEVRGGRCSCLYIKLVKSPCGKINIIVTLGNGDL